MRPRVSEFSTETPASYPTQEMKDLFEAILALRTEDEATKFFRDLLTVAELTEFANRWRIVKLLQKGESYTAIAGELGVSTTTVTRVAHWLKNGMGGYQLAASRLFHERTEKTRHKPFKLHGKYTFLKH